MKRCVYSIRLPEAGVCCNVYSNSQRSDNKWWAHWPKCSPDNCPIQHPELLEGATFNEKDYKSPLDEFVTCNTCSYWEDCDNKESRDGCYFGEVIDEI